VAQRWSDEKINENIKDLGFTTQHPGQSFLLCFENTETHKKLSGCFSIVHFSLSGLNEAGVWSYSAKLYPDSTSAPKTLVDVTAVASDAR
jgi:hypothetical protein